MKQYYLRKKFLYVFYFSYIYGKQNNDPKGWLFILNLTTMITSIFWIVPVASVLALVFAWFFFRQMMKESEGTETMAKSLLMCVKVRCRT